jgi:hypothetical protein
VSALGAVVVAVACGVWFGVRLGAVARTLFLALWCGLCLPLVGTGAGGARSLTTPSPLRCDVVVNDLVPGLVGGRQSSSGGG